MSLAMWLRNGRAQKNYSLEDVARITKIQPRILERLEGGRLDGLPAEVFVRGFVRSFARCVGLDEDEALRRYSACGRDGKAPPNVGLTGVRAVIDAMGDLAPNARANTPKILRDEPESLAAGSMEIPTVDSGESAEVPVEITFAEASEVVSMPDEPAVDKLEVVSEPAEQVVTEQAVTEQAVIEQAVIAEAVDAVVVAPPADMDLSAGIAIPAATTAKKKRTRKTAPTDGAAPRRTRRSKVATGTPAEPTPVVATDASEQPAKPARRRKPRGSVQPPIIETVIDSETITAEPVATIADAIDDAPAPSDQSSLTIETTSSDGAIAIESLAAAASVDVDVAVEDSTVSAAAVEFATFVVDSGATSAADELFGEKTGASIDSSQTTEAGGEIEGQVATAVAVDSPSSIEVIEMHEEGATSRFERVEEEAPLQLAEPWTPRMPPFAMPSAPSWRRSPAAPALVAVIDDADPEGAERALEDRRSRETRRTFLPPILLDRDGDRSTRQGGLTLAVIILLIAATLTLSYLMRRPSAAGDGVTQRDSITDTRIG